MQVPRVPRPPGPSPPWSRVLAAIPTAQDDRASALWSQLARRAIDLRAQAHDELLDPRLIRCLGLHALFQLRGVRRDALIAVAPAGAFQLVREVGQALE